MQIGAVERLFVASKSDFCGSLKKGAKSSGCGGTAAKRDLFGQRRCFSSPEGYLDNKHHLNRKA